MLSTIKAARQLGVSSTTLRNWVKTGYIQAAQHAPLAFDEQTICLLEKQILRGSKLAHRANKRGSVQSVIPREYSKSATLALQIGSIVRQLRDDKVDCELILWLSSVQLLINANECHVPNTLKPIHAQGLQWTRHSVKRVILDWWHQLGCPIISRHWQQLISQLPSHSSDDVLGLVYQSLRSAGNKSLQGAYYTPSNLVDSSLASLQQPIVSFLDPCCGTGQYLLKAGRYFMLPPEKLMGFDCDPLAVRLANINLLLAYPEVEFTPRIQCLDSLCQYTIDQLDGTIDCIATNPPWGAYKGYNRPGHYHSGSQESFSLFLERAIQLLSPGGQLSFILPESILHIKAHRAIRQRLVKDTQITQIARLGRQFTGVFTPVIRLNLIKQMPTETSQTHVLRQQDQYTLPQKLFLQNSSIRFDIDIHPKERDLLNKLYAVPHITLANHALWAMGIVTGNNQKWLCHQPTPKREAIYTGSDIHAYHLSSAQYFIEFMPTQFQQVAQESFFRAPEKLIYRFISKRLVFAYDNQQCLTLNSANILIPQLPTLNIKVVLAFLNSAVFQYLFKKKFATHKVLRGDLETLPFPLISQQRQQGIEALVKQVIDDPKHGHDAIDKLIFKCFRLTPREIEHIQQQLTIEPSPKIKKGK